MDSNEIPIDTDELARNLAEAEMPDVIYAWRGFQDNGSWDNKPCPCDSHASIKYVRADIASAHLEQLKARTYNQLNENSAELNDTKGGNNG